MCSGTSSTARCIKGYAFDVLGCESGEDGRIVVLGGAEAVGAVALLGVGGRGRGRGELEKIDR